MRIVNQCTDPKALKEPITWGGTSHTVTKVENGWRIDYAGNVAAMPSNNSITGTVISALVDGTTMYQMENLFFEGSGSKVVQGWLQCSQAEQSVVKTMGFGCFAADTAPY